MEASFLNGRCLKWKLFDGHIIFFWFHPMKMCPNLGSIHMQVLINLGDEKQCRINCLYKGLIFKGEKSEGVLW